MPRYLSDRELGRLSALEGLDGDARYKALADAGELYRYVTQNEWVARADLDLHFQAKSWSPDRLNLALALLEQAERLFASNTDPGVVAGATRAQDLSTLTVEELRVLAKAEGIEGYSTLRKDELIAALS
jgi:hypothetical protein